MFGSCNIQFRKGNPTWETLPVNAIFAGKVIHQQAVFLEMLVEHMRTQIKSTCRRSVLTAFNGLRKGSSLLLCWQRWLKEFFKNQRVNTVFWGRTYILNCHNFCCHSCLVSLQLTLDLMIDLKGIIF